MTKKRLWAWAGTVSLVMAAGCGSTADDSSGADTGAGFSPSSSGGGTSSSGPGATSSSGGSSSKDSGAATSSGGASGSGSSSGARGGSSSGSSSGAASSSGSSGARPDAGSAAGGDASSPDSGQDAAKSSTSGLIQNDVFWKDTSGTPLYSQSGNVIKVGSTYYWYGNKYQGAVTYAANPTALNAQSTFVAVTCYSSTDLVHWTFENNVLVPGAVPGSSAADWFGRMGVAYNATTKKYVLVMEYIPTSVTLGEELFATSSAPTGPFVFDHIQSTLTNVANGAPGDQTVFTDDDGQAYLILSSANGRANLYVAPLRPSDFLDVEPATRIYGGAGREGNCMFKYNGRYYFNSSDLHGWNASHTYTISATSILGPYSAETVMAHTDADFSHVTQTGFFITVQGTSQSTVIFAGDRWSDFAGNGMGYNQWVPLTFVGTAPQFQSLSQWSLDAVTGTWTVGAGNNYALNPSFEADRVTMAQPAGWTTSGTASSNATGGHTGRWKWRFSATSAYQSSIAQTLTGLPDGTYTLAAWIEGSGGQAVAQLFATGFGAAEIDASVSSASATWSHVSIPGIAVTNGTCQIGVKTTASANQSLEVDDVTFVKD
jgi:Glycosyl hydrolases family 43